MKKTFLNIFLAGGIFLGGCAAQSASQPPLPSPELEPGIRGEQFGIDKNINESTIDQYLGREDTIYRDMRMLVDTANYEAIGGDSCLSGIVEGFEVVPYPYLCNVEGLPAEVGEGYSGNTLFTVSEDGYTANYDESMEILEYLFPKDKNIILMCGGGGYAGMTKNMLVSLGWNADHIYNAGGFWFYEGEHAVSVKREENGKVYHDFHKLPYHHIEFNDLHRIGEVPETTGTDTPIISDIPVITAEELNQKVSQGDQFALFIYLPGCVSCRDFSPVISEYEKAGLVDIYAFSLEGVKAGDTILKDEIKYTPAVVIIDQGEIVARLLPDKDEDIPYYKNTENLSEWFHDKIGTEIISGTAESEITDCNSGCEVHIKG
ncbi:MAG: hypothetical protein IIZ27_06800 [Solobacterium sp.]|nr:hypothetical protein [Solobacterium sp.]